jgi:hypothetical protein
MINYILIKYTGKYTQAYKFRWKKASLKAFGNFRMIRKSAVD